MNPRIVLRHDAIEDIDGISDYIARDNFDAAQRFRAMVRQEIGSLSKMPRMGAIREFDNPRLHGVRS